MKILKEEKIEEYECPKCKRGLDFECNEMIKDRKILGMQFWKTSNDGWFKCERCNKRYLIKDYAKSQKENSKVEEEQ